MAMISVGETKYGSLAEAVAGAKTGDTIAISGAHTGQLTINRELIVVGTGGASITSAAGPALQCCASGVKISGVELSAADSEVACVTVAISCTLALDACEVRNYMGDGVRALGECVLTSCKVLECGAYGMVAHDGGLIRTSNSTIALNTKTGALARGRGARIILGEGTTIEKNKLHGVGADGGGALSASKTSIRENAYLGVNVGEGSKAQLNECLIHNNALHGIQVTAGNLEVSQSAITKAGKLGVFVNPPPQPPAATGAAQARSAEDEQRRAWVRLDRVEVTNCGFFGVHITGGYLDATDVDILQSGDSGIVCKGGITRMSNCTISNNTKYGVSLSCQPGQGGALISEAQGELKECTIAGNAGLGVHCSGAVCTLVGCKVLRTRLPPAAEQAAGSGVAAVLGGLVSISGCKIAENATFGIFVSGGRTGVCPRISGVTVGKTAVIGNGTYGASVAQASPDSPFSANLRIASGCDFSFNAQGEVEGIFSKETPAVAYLGVVAALVAVAAIVVWRSKRG
jgi:hypothetical protein